VVTENEGRKPPGAKNHDYFETLLEKSVSLYEGVAQYTLGRKKNLSHAVKNGREPQNQT
jgi:hypothetical protein